MIQAGIKHWDFQVFKFLPHQFARSGGDPPQRSAIFLSTLHICRL